MSVHYKFKSALTYDTITFDGLHISVKDLKKDILQQKQIGKTADFDLQITNAQTNEVYVDENALIPKNSSLIVVRIPLTAQQKRAWEKAEANQQLVGGKPIGIIFEGQDPGVQRLAKTVDLSSVDASEDDKILAMMTQSTFDYDPSNYLRIRGSCQVGEVPASYRCFKCHQPGHWIKDCKLSNSAEPVEIRKSTGIPRSFMVPVEGPAVPGAMMTPSGQFAVPSIDHQAYLEGKKPSAPEGMQPEKPNIPEDLVCSICHDLLTDTVMVPCCGTSFCDECIRMVLLESENHQCPDCKEHGVSPETLIPNRYLRTAVNNFRNQTGYQRTTHHQAVQDNAVYHKPPPALVVVNTEPLHPPGVDIEPMQLPKRTQMTPSMDARTGFNVIKVEERPPTPTIDERTTQSLPDTSVPPPIQPVQAFPIQPIGGGMMPYPPGYSAGPFTRAPIIPMYSNIGPGPIPGPRPNFPMDPARGMRRDNNYNRAYSRNRGRGHSYRGNNNIPQGAIIEDPLAAFEKMLREKDTRHRQLRRQRRSFSRSHSRSRSRSRSPPPRKRSRSRSVSQRLSRSRSRSLSPRVSRHISRSHSVSPRPTRTPPKTIKVSSRSPVRSRTRTRSRSRSVSRVRSRTRSRSPVPTKRRTRSFTISRSRSRSLSRSPSPLRRDRHYSPHRHDVRYRSPIPGRNSPQRYGSRNKDYENYYETDVRRGRGRGRYQRGRGSMQSYSPSNSRYDNHYEQNQSNRGYMQSSNHPEPLSQQRYNSRRYEPFDIIPPGTGPDLPNVTSYRGYQDDYLTPPGVTEHRIVTFPAESKRERDLMRDSVRDLAARDWERTRDREIEQRERERQREYEERYGYQKRQQSQSPPRDKHRKRLHDSKENKHHPVQAIESVLREHYNSEPKDEGRVRVPVLVDLKKEPSVEKDKKKDSIVLPTKEKKKEKEKRKKRKEGEGEKKKKKKKEKKDVVSKGKIELKVDEIAVSNRENKIPVELKQDVVEKFDPLYGDIEGTSVDQTVVENYVKIDDKNDVSGGGNTTEVEVEPKEPVVLAPMPELSKWELEEDMPSQEDKNGGDDGSGIDKKIVTSEVLKRAENAIFQKAINAIRPFETNKKPVVVEKPKEKKEPEQPIQQKPIEPVVDTREARKIANTIQITIPTSVPSRVVERSVEVAPFPVDQIESTKSKTRLDRSKFTPTAFPSTSPVRLSAKERLGAKVDQEERHKDDSKRVRSAVERKSKSRSPRKYVDRKVIDRDKHRDSSPGNQRRVMVSSRVIGRDRRNDRSRSRDRRYRDKEKRRERSTSRDKRYKKDRKHDKDSHTLKKKEEKSEERQVTVKLEIKKDNVSDKKVRKNPRLAIDRKKVTLDEASFEPDYDESTSPESEPEVPGEEKSLLINMTDKNVSPVNKRSRSVSIEGVMKKKQKNDEGEEKSEDKVIKESEKNKKPEVLSEESSDTESSSDSSSDSSIETKKKHRKKKKSKKRKKKKSRKRKDTSSESDSSDTSDSDSDSGKGKKKKHKHRSKKKKSKKSKKSKHK